MKKEENKYTWVYVPQKDITAYELSLVIKALINPLVIDNLPQEALRHFKKSYS